MSLTLTDPLTRSEVGSLVALGRSEIQVVLDLLRPGGDSGQPLRELRAGAEALAELGRAVLATRAEVRTETIKAAIHPRVLAHQLYGDQDRASEILNLNPQLAGQGPLLPAGSQVLVHAW